MVCSPAALPTVFVCQMAVLRDFHSLLQSDFSKESNLLLLPSISSILSFPSAYPVAAYVFFFTFSVYSSIYVSIKNVF
jgi:hypothetical protein